MNNLDLHVLMAGSAALILVLTIAMITTRRLLALANTVATQAAKIVSLENSLTALLSCSRRIGDRIGDVERIDRTLQKQIDKLSFSNDDGQIAIEHAMKLLASGRDMHEVTQICDLTEGEVEILQNLSRYQSAA
jgi:hypothetical protein